MIVIGFAFTTHWWVAGMAGTHHYAGGRRRFLLLALNLAVRRRPGAVGLALGWPPAAGSRPA